MKRIKFLAFALVAMFVCVGFASCSDDDKDEPRNPADLIGTVWKGTNAANGYTTKVEITDGQNCEVTIYDPSGDVVDVELCVYAYDGKTGKFSVVVDGERIEGVVKGKTMTVTVSQNGRFVLKRIK